MKKVIATVMTLAMVGSLFAGCSNSSAGSSSKDSSSGAALEKCEITYLTWSQSADNAYPQNMLDAFMAKNPNVKVNLEVGPSQQADYEQQQKVKLLAGEGIDVSTLQPSSFKNYVDAGYMEDLTGSDFIKNYTDTDIKSTSIDGKVYAIPYAKDVEGIMYNKDMFKKNGWEVPTCKEEWLELCDKVAATGVTPMVNGAKDGWPLQQEVMPFMQGLYINNPTVFEDVKSGKIKYDDAKFTDTLKEIQSYFKSKAVTQDAMGLTYDQSGAYFATGKSAMICHGEWIMGVIDGANPSFEIGVFQLPYNKKGEKQIGTAEVGQLQFVASCSKHKDAAKALVDFMSNKEGAELYAKSMGNFTAVKGISTDSKKQWNDLTAVTETMPFYYDQMGAGASSEFGKQLQLLYTGNATPESISAALQSANDKENK